MIKPRNISPQVLINFSTHFFKVIRKILPESKGKKIDAVIGRGIVFSEGIMLTKSLPDFMRIRQTSRLDTGVNQIAGFYFEPGFHQRDVCVARRDPVHRFPFNTSDQRRIYGWHQSREHQMAF